MPYTVRTNYDRGYVIEELDNGTDPCESWILLPAENLWNPGLRGFLYCLAIAYFFVGVAIASDIFMSAIEQITSKKRTVVKWDKDKDKKIEITVLVWNETVANLTLMALGSSAPEILLATLETVRNLGSTEITDSLGTFTIIGSAAFNLLIITAICIVAIPTPDIKRVREFGVFMMTAFWSMWAYIWMLLVVGYISPGVIDPAEAWVTLAHMPLFVGTAYCQDQGWWCKKRKVDQGEDDHMRIVNQRQRAGSFTGHILPGKELRVLEAERAEREKHTRLSGCSISGYTRSSDSQCSQRSTTFISVHSRESKPNESETSIEMESTEQHPMSSAETKMTTLGRVEKHTAEGHFARARFRHAVVSAMTGGARKPQKKHMSDVVETQLRIQKAEREGKAPEGDVLGKFTFSSDRYAVLESAGHLEVDILFHRNIPTTMAYVQQVRAKKGFSVSGLSPISRNGWIDGGKNENNVPNGDAVLFRNGSVKVAPESQGDTVTGVVTVEYETREGSAKMGKDFRYMKEELVFKEDEYRKTISIPIINDNQFESDVDFYIILKSPHGGSGIGDPSVARVTIVDDDEPGEFEFDMDHVLADLNMGKVVAKVTREHGFDGMVTIEYSTIDGTATGGRERDGPKCDYIAQHGVLTFNHSETSKIIVVDINKNAKGPKNFIITLKNPSLGAKIGHRSAIVCNITKDELGDRLAEVVDEEEEDTSWGGQFKSAMTVGGGTDDDGNEIPPSWSDYVLHFLTFFWKIVGACIPPTKYWGAWPAFVLSLTYIGALTAVVEQLGHLIGCVIGLKTSVTGITIIALGTSLPDTFASRTAAKQDEHADAAIGNVTGSNSVNVFLGLGIPWVISTMYHLARGTKYEVASDNLTQSVIIFSSVGAVCIIILILRRKFVGGELGGKNQIVKWGSSITMLLLWVIYILLASLKAYDILDWEV